MHQSLVHLVSAAAVEHAAPVVVGVVVNATRQVEKAPRIVGGRPCSAGTPTGALAQWVECC